MPHYSEDEYHDLEMRLIREQQEAIKHHVARYERLMNAAKEALEALNPDAERCSVWYNKFTGDWTPPDNVQCEHRSAYKGQCIYHLAGETFI